MIHKNVRDVYNDLDEGLYLERERTAEEVNFITHLFPLETHARILDLGCGNGRIALPLAELGYEITGIDFRREEIEKATSNTHATNTCFIQGDYINNYSQLVFGRFDLAMIIYAAFGEIVDSEFHNLLKHVYESLNDGGSFFIDALNKSRVEQPSEGFLALGKQSKQGLIDVLSCYRKRELIGNMEKTTFDITYVDNQKAEYHYIHRIFAPEEIEKYLQKVGFSHIRFYGAYTGETLKETSPRMIVIAQK